MEYIGVRWNGGSLETCLVDSDGGRKKRSVLASTVSRTDPTYRFRVHLVYVP